MTRFGVVVRGGTVVTPDRSSDVDVAVTVAPDLFQALPYVMTIIVLVVVSSGTGRRRLGASASVGVPYVREER